MRKAFVALAAFGLALAGAAAAQGPDGSGGTQSLPSSDAGFYGAVARARAPGAALDTDVSWVSQGRSGTVRFSATDGGCRDFFLRERDPTPRPPVIGRVCPLQGAAKSDTPIYLPSNVRYAAAAGPGGEPRPSVGNGGMIGGSVGGEVSPPRQRTGATRGIGAPSPQPPPPLPPSPGSGTSTRSATIPVAGRIVPLTRLQDRLDRAGGHAVILFRKDLGAGVDARNRALCDSMLLNFQETTFDNTVIGVEKEADGTYVAIRPIFWPTNPSVAAGTGTRCQQKLRQFDYGRAAAILDKIDRTGAGPFLVVSRDDQRQAAIIEMTGLTTAQIPGMVEYFRTRFSQQNDIWSPAVNTPQARRDGLVVVFRNGFTQNLVQAITLFSASSARIASGCLNDAKDSRSCG